MKDTPRRLCVGVFGFSEKAYLYGHDLFSLLSSIASSDLVNLSSSFCAWVSPSFDSSSGMPSFWAFLNASTASPACVAQADAGGFRLLAYLLDQLFAALFGQGRNRQAYLLAVVRGVSPMLESMIAFSIARIRFCPRAGSEWSWHRVP